MSGTNPPLDHWRVHIEPGITQGAADAPQLTFLVDTRDKIWPMPKIWDNIIILQLRTIKLICQPFKQTAWSPLSFFPLILQSQLHHFHHLFHPQSEHEHSSSPLSTRTAAAEVISVHFTPGNAKIAACYLHFCGFQLSEIRMISLVGLNQTVGHNDVVFPSISPCKLSLLRWVSLATELSCPPVCACVRVCAYAWMSKYRTPYLRVTGVCVIFKWVWHARGFSKVKGSWGLIQPMILMGANVLLLWHSSIIMIQWTHSLL